MMGTHRTRESRMETTERRCDRVQRSGAGEPVGSGYAASGTSGSLPAALFDASQQAWIGIAAAADAGNGVTVILPAPSPVARAPSPAVIVLLRLDGMRRPRDGATRDERRCQV